MIAVEINVYSSLSKLWTGRILHMCESANNDVLLLHVLDFFFKDR